MHPLTKIIIVFCITSCSLIYQQTHILIGLLILSMFLFALSKPEQERLIGFFKQLRNLLPIVLSIFIIQLLFDKQGTVIYKILFINITRHGLDTALQVSLRLLIILFTAMYLTRLSIRDFLNAFRLIHLPEALGVMTAITIGYIPHLAEQIKTSRQQIILRGIDIKKLNIRDRIWLFQSMIMPVLGKTLTMVKYQAIALDLRGFRNSMKHTHYQKRGLAALDWSVIILAAFLLLLPVL